MILSFFLFFSFVVVVVVVIDGLRWVVGEGVIVLSSLDEQRCDSGGTPFSLNGKP